MKLILRAAFAEKKKRKVFGEERPSEVFIIPDGATVVGGALEGYGSMISMILYTEEVKA